MFKRTAPAFHSAGDQVIRRHEYRQSAGLAALLESQYTALLHFLYRMVQDLPLAEELTTEALSQFGRRSAETGSSEHAITRLFRLATALALKEPRYPRRTPVHANPDALAVGRAVAAIPAKQRAAMLMHKYHRMDFWQIATVLDCPENVAKSLLVTAYESLRLQLAPHIARQAAPPENCAAR